MDPTAMVREREREREHGLDTPKTPTASAWWALMEDAPFDERTIGPVLPTQPTAAHSGRPQWASGLWNILIAESPSDELDRADTARLACSPDRGSSRTQVVTMDQSLHSNGQLPSYHQPTMPAMNSTACGKQQEDGDNTNNASFLHMLRCGNLEGNPFLRFEEELSNQLNRADSPCKMMTQPSGSVFDVYDEEFYELYSESGDDSGVIDITNNSFDDDILNELKDEITSLRERNEGQISSSKYKDILCAATSEVAERPEQEIHPSASYSPETINMKQVDGKVTPLSTRKFPVENTIDQLPLQFAPNATPVTPTYGDVRKGSPSKKYSESPTRTLKTARTEGTARASDLFLPDTAVVTNDDSRPHTASSAPPSDIDAVLADALIKKVSTLSVESEFSALLFKSSQDMLLPHTDSSSSKMCLPPLLLKKLSTLKNIKLSRSQSSSQSVKTSMLRALKKGSVPAAFSAGGGDAGDVVYEYECQNHAYIAFFRRGTKAAHSIRLYEHPIPVVFPTLVQEVVVKIEASPVSMTDLLIRRGDIWGESTQRALNLPIVPGVSFAGRVYQIAQSSDRTGLCVGDRVTSLVQVGANSRHLCIGSEQLVKVPDELNDPCAVACLPEMYLSAFQALHMGQKNGARYRKTSLSGKCILVLGGANVLGQALIEVAVAAGSGTVYATGKERQFPAIAEAGGAPLGRDPRHWCSILAKKVDVVVGIDNSIGKSELKQEHLELLARGGRVVLMCKPDRDDSTAVDLEELAELSKTGRKLFHYNVFDAWEGDLKQGKRDLTHLLKLLADGLIRPKILERIPLNRVARAQDLIDGKKLNGFILCEPWIKGKKKGEAMESDVYAESASSSKSTTDADDDTIAAEELRGRDTDDESRISAPTAANSNVYIPSSVPADVAVKYTTDIFVPVVPKSP